MHTGQRNLHTHHTPSAARRDDGFTLVELLIVIVILGILATVTVFAVRGITDRGQENSEATDLKSLQGAVEGYYAINGSNPADELALTDPALGLLAEESQLHDYAPNLDGTYTITNLRTGATYTGGGATAPAVPAPAATEGIPVVWGGLPALQYGAGPNPVTLIGGAVAGAQWDAAIQGGAVPFPGRTIYFVDVADITTTAEADALHAAIVPFPRRTSVADDVPNFDGAISMLDYLDAQAFYAKLNDGSGWEAVNVITDPGVWWDAADGLIATIRPFARYSPRRAARSALDFAARRLASRLDSPHGSLRQTQGRTRRHHRVDRRFTFDAGVAVPPLPERDQERCGADRP